MRSEEAKPGEDKEDKGAGGDQHEVVELQLEKSWSGLLEGESLYS